MTRGIDRGTGISRAHSNGTFWKPIARAAAAGNWALRSLVAVKMQLTTLCGESPLRAMTACMSSLVASRMSCASLCSTLIAPLRAKSRCIGAILSERPEALDLGAAQLPIGPRLKGPQAQGSEGDALQLEHRVAQRLAHPPYLAVAALVDRHLDQVPAHAPHLRGRRRGAVERHAATESLERALAELPAAQHGAIRLGHLERGVGQPVGELAVVGEQDQAAGVGVEPSDGIQAQAARGDEPYDRRTPVGIARGRDDAQ